jgi:hypothetical protein
MKIPETIYLQWHGDSQVPEDEMSAPHLDEVTWCADRVYDGDIEYRRVRECVWRTDHKGLARPDGHAAIVHASRVYGWPYCPYCTGKIRLVGA